MGVLTKAKDFESALGEARIREVPLVVIYELPDSKITNDLRELTGKEGDLVFLSIDKKSKDAEAIGRRYDLGKPGAVMTDEFGNLLATDLAESDDIVEAFYYIDELIAEQLENWNEAIAKGRKMVKNGQHQDAAGILQVFAFASGSKEATEGKKLFDIVARAASAELEKIVGNSKPDETSELDAKARRELAASLAKFIARWPKTPAAFSADARIKKLASSRKSL